MSLTGSGPDDPQRVGVPIADLLAGMYGAYGVVAALHERHRTGVGTVVRTSLLAATVGRARLPGHALDRGRRGRPRAGQPPPLASRRTASSTAATAPSRSRSAARACGSSFCAGFGARPRRRGPGHQPRAGRPTASGSSSWSRASFAELGRRAAAGPAGRGRHPGGQGAHASTRSTRGTRPLSQGLLVDVEHPTLGRRHPARPAAAVLRRRRRRGDHPPRPRRTPDAGPARRRRSGPGWRTTHEHPTLERHRAARPGARRRLLRVVGRSRSTSPGTRTAYRAELRAAAERSGTDESVLTGRGLVRGRPVAVVVNEFRFLAGLDRPGRRASGSSPPSAAPPPRGIPLLATTASGGTRMQEGTPAFVRDGRDLPRADGPPRRRPALPGLPAPPHDRRRLRLVGLARRTSRSPSRRR